MNEDQNNCMNCGYCHDCIVATMEAFYEAEANVWVEENKRLKAERAELLAKIEMLMNEASILRDLIKEMNDEINPPERNCSCHISPPCSDCVDHEHARELKARAESYIS
jgi:predicted nuclease with TOPRIM domain